jgi:hypothetical protein
LPTALRLEKGSKSDGFYGGVVRLVRSVEGGITEQLKRSSVQSSELKRL